MLFYNIGAQFGMMGIFSFVVLAIFTEDLAP